MAKFGKIGKPESFNNLGGGWRGKKAAVPMELSAPLPGAPMKAGLPPAPPASAGPSLNAGPLSAPAPMPHPGMPMPSAPQQAGAMIPPPHMGAPMMPNGIPGMPANPRRSAWLAMHSVPGLKPGSGL